jgi:RNA polymerase sigma-70 factor (ECF subfamily)
MPVTHSHSEHATAQDAVAATLLRLRQRDLHALDALYELSVERLHAIACRVCGNHADAEEVVADVYQYAWERAADFDPDRGSGLAWLSMLTWSRASERRRRQRPMLAIEALHPELAPAPYASCEDGDPLAALVDGHRVREALAQIDETPRRLILMAFFEGASHGEIAGRTGLPLGTVKSHIRRGLEKLRTVLEEMRA